jgi:XTP/dITP diphosphohydrolase
VPAPVKRLVLASANPGKLSEFRTLLRGAPFDLTSLGELKLPSPEETGTTYFDNALLKARHAARLSGFGAIADDSGLEVDALDGAPGVYSARFAGIQGDDAANNAKLVATLGAMPQFPEPWPARYRCVLVLLREADDPAPLTAEGVWQGAIVAQPRGRGGFGYDPHFWLPELRATAAELDAGQKNRLSHRAAAWRALAALL